MVAWYFCDNLPYVRYYDFENYIQGIYFEKICVSLLNHSCHSILLLLKMKLASPPPLLNMLLTGLCLIPLFYKLFRVGNNLLRQIFGG